MNLTKPVKIGIAIIAGLVLLGLFRLTAVKRIPANTVGVKVSAFGGVQDTTLQTGYHLKLPFIDQVLHSSYFGTNEDYGENHNPNQRWSVVEYQY